MLGPHRCETVEAVTSVSVSTPMSRLSLSRATDADWDDIINTDARAFAMRNPLPDDERVDLRGKVADDDVVLVRDTGLDGHPLVGVSMFYRMSMSLPGTGVADAAGLSWVSVASTHRRRGILRRMLTTLFEQWESEDYTFAILTASEGTIYERFGFGPACFANDISITSGQAAMRQAQPEGATVRYADADAVAEAIPDLHARWTLTTPGALTRTPAWWKPILADRRSERPLSASGLHYLLHADGYASYRIHKDTTGAVRGEINEVFAVTDDAHTDLWRVLINLDLIPALTASIPIDDPLPQKLVDPRSAPVTGTSDTMWLRILDVPAALGSRQYGADLDAVIEVTDEFRGHGGVFDISVREGGAIVAPAAENTTPTVSLDTSVLSSIYLGGVAPSRFAAAGRLRVDSPTTLRALDHAFLTDRAPFSGTFF
ncbi:GNAT family N-acetyltransferase [Gordonia jinghuaiqii]|uniref:GNAT family N-acetyltransferase n=2 Tax=Gordonia jinghuaiqii TaxID=2758710 RepID=A0A7D7LVL9_9ACTN|nr:GNAT family N-acetyltransferase [Gordonia jinghuaiqii]QMT02701.1 GNAT family N-acetyltransferase [Gordonia jinghuaiqii]